MGSRNEHKMTSFSVPLYKWKDTLVYVHENSQYGNFIKKFTVEELDDIIIEVQLFDQWFLVWKTYNPALADKIMREYCEATK